MPFDSQAYVVFETLFRAHYNALANYAYSIVKNRQDAEDVAQDVFIKLWKNQPEVMHTSQVKFYLLTAVKNGCISLLRKQAGQYTLEPERLELAAVADITKEDKNELQQVVLNALALLPPQCLAIFKLSRFSGLTYQQIATELGLSVKTVENQMGKALRLLRDYARQHNIPYIILLHLIYGML
jgi:RNA polymerase sigma-70 factor (family 1)